MFSVAPLMGDQELNVTRLSVGTGARGLVHTLRAPTPTALSQGPRGGEEDRGVKLNYSKLPSKQVKIDSQHLDSRKKCLQGRNLRMFQKHY